MQVFIVSIKTWSIINLDIWSNWSVMVSHSHKFKFRGNKLCLRIEKSYIYTKQRLSYVERDLGFTLAQWNKLSFDKKFKIMDQLFWETMVSGMSVVDENGYEVDESGNVKDEKGRLIYKNK